MFKVLEFQKHPSMTSDSSQEFPLFPGEADDGEEEELKLER